MTERLAAPIGILDEHPEWSARLIAELQHRRLPFEKIDHSSHAFDPRDRARRYSVIVNRTSPSSHRRGHGSVRLWPESVEALFGAADRLPLLAPSWGKRYLDLAAPGGRFQDRPLPLGPRPDDVGDGRAAVALGDEQIPGRRHDRRTGLGCLGLAAGRVV